MTGEFVECPEPGCDQTAEVVEIWTLIGTGGKVRMRRTRCFNKHIRDIVVE